MRLAIVKPDHIGDLILSSAAIRTLLARFSGAHLYVATRNEGLARYLFPEAEIRHIDLPHLDKGAGRTAQRHDFATYDQIVVLRNDGVVDARWCGSRNRWYVQSPDRNDWHQSLIDYHAVGR